MEYFAKLPSERIASPRSMFAISPSCTGPTAGITKSAQIPLCTLPCPEKNPRPLKVSNGALPVSKTPPNSKRNHDHRFECHRFPGSDCRHEFPASQGFRGKRIQTFVRAVEDANLTHLPIGVDDCIERDHAVHIGANQFQRIARVRFFRGNWRQQFAFFPSRIKL